MPPKGQVHTSPFHPEILQAPLSDPDTSATKHCDLGATNSSSNSHSSNESPTTQPKVSGPRTPKPIESGSFALAPGIQETTVHLPHIDNVTAADVARTTICASTVAGTGAIGLTSYLSIATPNDARFMLENTLAAPDSLSLPVAPSSKSQAMATSAIQELRQRVNARRLEKFRRMAEQYLSSRIMSVGARGLLPRLSANNILINNVIIDLESSRYCLWIGDTNKIFERCTWVENSDPNSYTLMLKPNCLSGPAGDGPARIGWLGQVTPVGSNLTPDAGWIYASSLIDDTFVEHKRMVTMECPSSESDIPVAFWDAQLKGCDALIDDVRCKGNTNKMAVVVGRPFYDKESGTLTAQSPLFQAPSTQVTDMDDDYDSDKEEESGEEEEESNEEKSQIPESHCFHTWKVGLLRVKHLFEALMEEGYEPQILKAYDRRNRLIHPNHVYPKLIGSIAHVYATLEKRLFLGNRYPGGKAWRFYANLVKVQVLKPGFTKSVARKRCRVYKYDYSDAYPSDSDYQMGQVTPD